MAPTPAGSIDQHERRGHLFGGRFKAFLVEEERYLATVLRYVVLNPVRAKMVERPEEYRWSSYRATAGLDSAPEWLDVDATLSSFGRVPETAAESYRTFVDEALGVDRVSVGQADQRDLSRLGNVGPQHATAARVEAAQP